jgi:DNA-3-methyladenine glycosylase II
MGNDINLHFKKADPILHAVLEKIGELEERKPQESDKYFEHLVDSIISQQLSGKAAATIFGRFVKLAPKGRITPENILKLKNEDIRACGVSNAKVSYIKDLAQKVKDKELNLKKLPEMEDEEVIAELTKVKGIGRWTAEMFLMFTLSRPDIFSHGDLGLKNAIKKIYQLENPTKEEVEAICSKWSPHKTVACRILWRSLDV